MIDRLTSEIIVCRILSQIVKVMSLGVAVSSLRNVHSIWVIHWPGFRKIGCAIHSSIDDGMKKGLGRTRSSKQYAFAQLTRPTLTNPFLLAILWAISSSCSPRSFTKNELVNISARTTDTKARQTVIKIVDFAEHGEKRTMLAPRTRLNWCPIEHLVMTSLL